MTDPRPLRVLAFAGALRAKSFNRALIATAAAIAPAGLAVTVWQDLDLPLYNQDVEDKGDPAAIAAFKAAVAGADALLISTPEYNHGVPAPLKNAIDWASRPSGKGPILRKPVAIMGASTGMIGTARAQGHLRQTLAALGCPALVGADVLVNNANAKFDAAGTLTDEPTRQVLARMLAAFEIWARRFVAA
ncbi:MAG: NAD(P)H-dependent oxidoreductase [Alphaproteobacteria bacterium]|nr:NAD(P)H-dependent oxidoreductase [Alphaproteobacteria bacterium]